MVLKRAIPFLLVMWLGGGMFAQDQVQTPSESFTIKVSGQKTWGIQLGFGDPTLLSLQGLSPGQLTLTQTLWAQIEGTVLDFLTIKASFNDQLGPGFQEFLVIVDRKPWYAELGRFVVGTEGDALGVYNKRVLGVRAAVAREEVRLGALLARLEGISESRTFTGTIGQAQITFSYEDPDRPWLPAPYLASVEGLYFFELRQPFVEGFSSPVLALRTGEALAQFLSDWGLGYLWKTTEKNATTSLASGTFLVVRDEEKDVLLLRQDPRVLLRNRVLDLIDLYNAAQGLTGARAQTYPFIQGSNLETAFLSGLSAFAKIQVDEEAYPLSEARRHRYLLLGETEVREDSLGVEVRLPGDLEFRPLTDPALMSYNVRLFPDPGILRFNFPEDFFRPSAALRVSFQYTREGASFFLGLSVIPGSERVYLNGQRLTRDVDYAIDYEVGLLTLFVTVGPEDEVQVDFERERGGLGVATEYERYFLGTSLELGPGRLEVWQAADFGTPSPTTRTMPNTHSLAMGFWQGKLGEWNYVLRLGFAQNVFPADDNARLPARNQINAIRSMPTADGEIVVLAHQNGITVYRGGRFSTYGAAEGMAGRAALCLLPLPNRLLIGNDGGLTLVDLSEPGAFDRVRSWTRLYPDDWNKKRLEKIQGKKVLALAKDETQVYMATEAELLVLPLSSLTQPPTWIRRPLPPGAIPTVLLWAQELYLGTTEGLFRWSPTGWERLDVTGTVSALLWQEGELLVAGDEGIRVLQDNLGTGWLAYGFPVRSLAPGEGSVWFAGPDGLYREGELVLVGNFTALGTGLGSLWAGTQADPDYQLEIWRVASQQERFPQTQTGIDGRDLGQFFNPQAEEHTHMGPAASLTLNRNLENWDLNLFLSSRFPGYEEIGRPSRSDAHGLGFSARFRSTDGLSLDLRGRMDLADLTTKPGFRLSGGLDGQWQGPLTLTFSVSPILAQRKEGTQLSSDFQVGLRAGTNPAWNLGLSGRLASPAFYLAGTLQGRINFQPWPGFSLALSWSRPYRTRGTPGTENLTLKGQLSGGDGSAWTCVWEETLSHALGQEKWLSSRQISGELRLSALNLPEGKLAPRLGVTATATPAEWRVSGTAWASAVLTAQRIEARFTTEHGFRPATERTHRSFSLNLSWSSSAWSAVQLSLHYSWARKILLHPRYVPQVGEEQSWEVRASFDLAGGKNELALSWGPDAGLKLTERLRYNSAFGPLTWEASATWKGKKFSAKSVLDTALALGSQWGLNLTGTVLFGAWPVRAAASFGATLIANF